MGLLYVGSEKTIFGADDRIVVSLEEAIRTATTLNGHVTLVSQFVNEDGVTTAAAFVSPAFARYGRCWAEPDEHGTPVDAEYVQRALECAESSEGFIVLDAHDEVVTDPDVAREVIAAAFNQDGR